MKALWHDVRYGLRQLRKSPGFTVIAVLSLALGIGVNTAMFSVVNTFILNPVPLPEGNRLVEINEIDQTHNKMEHVSPKVYQNLKNHPEIFEKTASFAHGIIDVSAAKGQFVERLFGCEVTPSFFDIFAAQPAIGRIFQKQEGFPGNDDVVIISHSLWQRRFDGTMEIIGQKLKAREKVYTIIGVMPSHFQFPSRKTLYWRPFQFSSKEWNDPMRSHLSNWWAIARLRRDVSQKKAQTFLDGLNERLLLDFPEIQKDRIIRARPLRDFFIDPELQKTLWALMGVIGFVLLIACANLANLQLARTESRFKEVSVRMTLGAGRWHILRQFLTESLLLSLFGGFGSVLIATWGVKILSVLVPDWSPLLRPIVVDQSVLFFAILLSIATGILFGLFPAWSASRIQLGVSLKESGSTASTGSGRRLFRNTLVVGEVALSFVLLVGATLMIRSVVRMLRIDPGYNPTHLARVDLTALYGRRVDFDWERTAFPEFAECLNDLPGTTAVGLMSVKWAGSWNVAGRAEPVESIVTQVGVGRLDPHRALGLALLEGRLFEQMDNTEGQTSVIVNESFARFCWPGESAVGKTIQGRWGGDATIRTRMVIGVVSDHKRWGSEDHPRPTVYEPFERDPVSEVHILVRTSLDPASLLQAVRREAREVLRDRTYVPSINWLEQVLWASTYSRRLYMHFLCAFGGAGLLLSGLGIVGVLAYSVNRRKREIGIRMALGAQSSDILKGVLGQGFKLTLVGLVIGLAGALAMTQVISSLLYDMSPTDPLTFGCVMLVLGLVALLASYIPARRAAEIDPMVALRDE